MYCPRCGEIQSLGNLRFCSKCGLPLGLVSEILSNDGTLPQLEEFYSKKGKVITRKNGIFFSIIWFVFFILLLTPFWAIMDVDELAGISSIIGVFGSLLIFLYSLFFLAKPPKDSLNQALIQNNNTAPQNLSSQQTQQNVLPPQQTQAARDFVAPSPASRKSYDTGDLVEPGSVTEDTTKLLQKEMQEEEEKTKYFDEK